MARRKQVEQPGAEVVREHDRVLIVVASDPERARLAGPVAGAGNHVLHAGTIAEATAALSAGRVDAILVRSRLPDGSGVELARWVFEHCPWTATIVVADAPTIDDAVDAMRSGATDLVAASAAPAELVRRIGEATARTRVARARDAGQHARVERLKSICRKLTDANQEVTQQVSSLCNDLVTAYQELSGQVGQMGLASEFNGLVRQELDVESLLRTTLEFVLAKVGWTNAAVFLPSSSSDYSLGAYVNYDCPRDTCELVLENLADVVAPRLQDRRGVLVMTGDHAVAEFLGEHAHWLANTSVAALACQEDDECLAVVLLFRDERQPFSDEHARVLGLIGELFGRQLARVIRVHHRHVPREEWGAFGEEAA